MEDLEIIFTEAGTHTHVTWRGKELNVYEVQILSHIISTAVMVYDENGLGVTEFDVEHFKFPRGHTPRAVNYITAYGYKIIWKSITPVQLEFNKLPAVGKLRPLQQWAVDEMLKHYYGIIELGTRFGKSYVYAGWFVQAGRPRTIIVVPLEAIAKQMHRELSEFLGEPVGIIARSTGIKDNWQQLTIVIDKSIFDKDGKVRPKHVEWLPWIEAVIRDECHHMADLGHALYRQLPRLIYSWGGSATPFTNKAVKDFKLEGVAGPVRVKAKAKLLASYGLVATLHCYWIEFQHRSLMGSEQWNVIYHNTIVMNLQRNNMIAQICKHHCNESAQGIVFVDRVEHGKIIQSLVEGSVFVSSKTLTPKQANKIKDAFNAKEIHTVITTKKWREGITFYADYVINAEGLRADHVTIQKAGRALMPRQDGKAVLWYDFLDKGIHQLHSQSLQRWDCMEAEGWNQEIISQELNCATTNRM